MRHAQPAPELARTIRVVRDANIPKLSKPIVFRFENGFSAYTSSRSRLDLNSVDLGQ